MIPITDPRIRLHYELATLVDQASGAGVSPAEILGILEAVKLSLYFAGLVEGARIAKAIKENGPVDVK
jgi:hypothetical protein